MLSVLFNQCIVFSKKKKKCAGPFCLCSVVCLYKKKKSNSVCARVCMCLFSQCVNKIKTPDKALIITEEQGYVDKEGLGLFFILSEGKKWFWRCWAWSIHDRCRFFLLKKHDIMPSTIQKVCWRLWGDIDRASQHQKKNPKPITLSVPGLKMNWNEFWSATFPRKKKSSWPKIVKIGVMSRLKKKESCAGVSVCYPELWVKSFTFFKNRTHFPKHSW